MLRLDLDSYADGHARTVPGAVQAVALVTPDRKAVASVNPMDHLARPPRKVVVEDPDELGYRLVGDLLFDVMPAEDWLVLERHALRGDDG